MQRAFIFLWMITALCSTVTSFAQSTPPALLRGPYLQAATGTSIHIRWRTDAPDKSLAQWGTAANNLSMAIQDEALVTDHEVVLTGLTPDTKYWYSIGSPTTTLQGDAENYFSTLPPTGAKELIRVGVIGDCGNNSINQLNVRNQLQNYLGSASMSAWILLGDNAYSYGLDDEYQSAFFNIYKDRFLKQSPLFPSPGNHDYSDNAALQNSHAMPYYSNFSMPVAGEGGGVPSNNKAYYSYNIGNVHFLSLDSYGQEDNTTRLYDTTGKQVQWIKQDLEANQNKDWVVAYWHHPPFSLGSRNSETEADMTAIRTNFIRILERYGVDLILCGHSHDYERSKLQKGFYGYEAEFNPALHDLSSSSALYDGSTASCPYIKGADNAGTVYVVTGSAGQLGLPSPGYPHDAMYYSNSSVGGSLLLEVEDNRLDAKWICADGVIRDRFTVMKNVNTKKAYAINPGDSVLLTASFTGNYQWSPGGAITKSIKVAPALSTTYYAADLAGCLRDTFNITITNVALPVAFGAVKGWYNKAERLVYINWQTVQEKDSHHFSIERSVDGATFTKAGTVAASGNTTAPKDYLFKDAGADPSHTLYYYRIGQADNNGEIKYSSIIAVNLATATTDFEVQVVPNPAPGSAMQIRLRNTGSPVPALLSLADGSGKIVATKSILLTPSAQSFLPVIPAGHYFLTVKTEAAVTVIQLVIR